MILRFCACLMLLASFSPNALARTSYGVDYSIEFLPKSKQARVTITLAPGDGRATRLDFPMDPERYVDVGGDGRIERKGERTIWTPPADGGSLQYLVAIDSQRGDGAYDPASPPDWRSCAATTGPHALVRFDKGGFAPRLRCKMPTAGRRRNDLHINRARDAYVIVNPAGV